MTMAEASAAAPSPPAARSLTRALLLLLRSPSPPPPPPSSSSPPSAASDDDDDGILFSLLPPPPSDGGSTTEGESLTRREGRIAAEEHVRWLREAVEEASSSAAGEASGSGGGGAGPGAARERAAEEEEEAVVVAYLGDNSPDFLLSILACVDLAVPSSSRFPSPTRSPRALPALLNARWTSREIERALRPSSFPRRRGDERVRATTTILLYGAGYERTASEAVRLANLGRDRFAVARPLPLLTGRRAVSSRFPGRRPASADETFAPPPLPGARCEGGSNGLEPPARRREREREGPAIARLPKAGSMRPGRRERRKRMFSMLVGRSRRERRSRWRIRTASLRDDAIRDRRVRSHLPRASSSANSPCENATLRPTKLRARRPPCKLRTAFALAESAGGEPRADGGGGGRTGIQGNANGPAKSCLDGLPRGRRPIRKGLVQYLASVFRFSSKLMLFGSLDFILHENAPHPASKRASDLGPSDRGIPTGDDDDDLSNADALILFTSGTSSSSGAKGVRLSHRALYVQARAKTLPPCGYDRDTDMVATTVPWFHVGGMSSALAVIMAGGRMTFPAGKGRGFDPGPVLRSMTPDSSKDVTGAANTLVVVPAMLHSLAAHVARNRRRCPRSFPQVKLVLVGGQSLGSGWLYHAARRLFPNARIVQTYACTEAGSSMTFYDLDWGGGEGKAPAEGRDGATCVGMSPSHVEIGIFASNGGSGSKAPSRLANGAMGIIGTRGPHVMSGYWRRGADSFRNLTSATSTLAPKSCTSADAR
ncbi:hypothetical protein ACHAWF_002777, partial [Thalassiosira exigua]